MTTEEIDPRYTDIDRWSASSAVEAMYEAQLSAVASVGPATGRIAEASEKAAERLMRGGRLIYVGAGTSGRIAVQDGVELAPTYSWPTEKLVFIIAGGMEALAASAEDAEDDGPAAVAALKDAQLSADDVVIGVAASGKTPFTVSALSFARELGALTIGLSNNHDTPLLEAAEIPLCAETGGETIAGSTRMKAGTAQKVVLNLFSTATMIRCGQVYKGLMVSMRISNDKLRDRAVGIVQTLTECGTSAARGALDASGGDIKLAVLAALGLELEEARTMLSEVGGNLRSVIEKAAAP